MKAHVFEVRDALHVPQVPAIALAQTQDGPAGTKHLFPKVRERESGRRQVNVYSFGLRLRSLGCLAERRCRDDFEKTKDNSTQTKRACPEARWLAPTSHKRVDTGSRRVRCGICCAKSISAGTDSEIAAVSSS